MHTTPRTYITMEKGSGERERVRHDYFKRRVGEEIRLAKVMWERILSTNPPSYTYAQKQSGPFVQHPSASCFTKKASHTLLPRSHLHIRKPPARSAEGFCTKDLDCFCAHVHKMDLCANTFMILCIHVRRPTGQRTSVKAHKSCALAPSIHRHQDTDAHRRTHGTCTCTCGSLVTSARVGSCLVSLSAAPSLPLLERYRAGLV